MEPTINSSAFLRNKYTGEVIVPAEYNLLKEITEPYYGLNAKTDHILKEFFHPHPNWEQNIKELNDFSISSFFYLNNDEKGNQALDQINDLYFNALSQAKKITTKVLCFRYWLEYLEKILSTSDENLERNIPTVIKSLNKINDYLFHPNFVNADNQRQLLNCMATVPYKRFSKAAYEMDLDLDYSLINKTMVQLYESLYQYWLQFEDPYDWDFGFKDNKAIKREYQRQVEPISHKSLKENLHTIKECEKKDLSSKSITACLIELPNLNQLTSYYLDMGYNIEKAFDVANPQLFKIKYLLKLLDVEALSEIQNLHDDILKDINRSIGKIFKIEDYEELSEFITTLFETFQKEKSNESNISTIINTSMIIGKEILERKNKKLFHRFTTELLNLGFQTPQIKGKSVEWKYLVSTGHIKNIKGWLSLISMDPAFTRELLSAFVIYLRLGGVFVNDTDLIQRDISRLLNAKNIKSSYNLVKQLCKLFPVYFEEIGAEGELRELSTEIDELASRHDYVVHFFRKECHVEANNTLIEFAKNLIFFWGNGDKTYIKKYLPEDLYEQLITSPDDPIDEETYDKAQVLNYYENYYKGMHDIFFGILNKIQLRPSDLLRRSRQEIEKLIEDIAPQASDRDKKRAFYIVIIYQLMVKKYYFGYQDIIGDLKNNYIFSKKDVNQLEEALDKKDYTVAINLVLKFLKKLKKVIANPEKTDPVEKIYFKRHIAAGIPSMYGFYKEEKFNALGLTYRLEQLAKSLFEDYIQTIPLSYIAKSTLETIYKTIKLFIKALSVDGIAVTPLMGDLNIIKESFSVAGFSLDQYINVFRHLARNIQGIMNKYYINIHSSNLEIIVPQLDANRTLKEKFIISDNNKTTRYYNISEKFIRDIISDSYCLQTFDNFIGRVLSTLINQSEILGKNTLRTLLSFSADKCFSDIDKPDPKVDNRIYLGNKGYYLKYMKQLDFPIPPAFIITTEVHRCLKPIRDFPPLNEFFLNELSKHVVSLEIASGKELGNPSNPLILSIRSGSAISMPGMLDTFINVGLNIPIIRMMKESEKYDMWSAWDSYRRFLQSWGMAKGLERELFDKIIEEVKKRHNVLTKKSLLPQDMEEIAIGYYNVLDEYGKVPPDNPFDQLVACVQGVVDSWNTRNAKLYRDQMQIASEWGTAIIVQEMVLGNKTKNLSGTGVLLTKKPTIKSNSFHLYGDYVIGNQGEDVVDGLVDTFPITHQQAQSEALRYQQDPTLESRFPAIYHRLSQLARILFFEQKFNHQEMEFTFESDKPEDLYILQTRDLEDAPEAVPNLPGFEQALAEKYIASGIGVGGEIISGIVIHTEEEIDEMKKKHPKTPIILIKHNTVPDDINLIVQVDGLLTAKGGVTSHASVAALRLGRVCVVGCRKLEVNKRGKQSIINGKVVKSGEWISINGSNGAIYLGKIES